ncbi:FAD-dependent oxidoreductase [Amycolatopsis pithecellobii]|uniref:NAD(P)-binding protein n=1 Tax=Amycolatopsis pithecellobii TaxID=664692 RepID=A0A6N7YYR2_9PSEU|nr:NAD(P)/FAD-dependent oxidoreductase [Amycolatopsis pithecellobii]MTD52581.1 NAD(P)-binding protein [Amycolatopsis pithecellobii]
MKAVIIGGGIGGLALAATLERNNIECVVHERRADLVSVGSALVLHPNGLAAVKRIDSRLHAEIAAAGYSLPDGTPTFILDGDGQVISRRVLPPPLRPVTIRRAELHRLLRSHSTTATMVYGSTFLRYETDRNRVRVHLTRDDLRGRSGDFEPVTETMTGDVLIGADGLHSRVRRQLLNDGDARPMGLTSIKCIAKMRHDDPYLRGGFILFGRNQQAFCAPLGPDVVYWDVTIRAGAGTWPHELEQIQRELLKPQWGWPALVQNMIAAADLTEMIVTDLRDRKGARRWSRGAVTLLGDAAHPMSPFLGQGTNQALLDADVLAKMLSSHRDDPAEAFRHYEMARRDSANQAMRDSRRVGFEGQTGNPFVRWKRNRSLRRAVTP